MSGSARTPVKLFDDGGPSPGDASVEWSDADRALLGELLEDAASALQRDLILRAVDAGHTARTVHGFADSIRPMEDHALFTACAKPPSAGASLHVLLRAQADPVFALALHAGVPGTTRPRTPEPLPLPAPAARRELGRSPEGPGGPSGPSGGRGASARGRGDEATVIARVPEARPEPGSAVRGVQPRGFAEDLFNAAAEFAGVRYQERVLDEAAFTLAQAIPLAAEALARGVLVPVVLGARVGELRRYALMLQVHGRAFQLHDPFVQEVVWAHEADLLGGRELPFTDKALRRITAIALPVRAAAGVGGFASGFDPGAGERRR